MGDEPLAKSFKSGNSVAIRIPQSLGIEPGQEFIVVKHTGGGLTMIQKDRLKDNFMALAGAMSPDFMKDGRMSTEQLPRDWSRDSSEGGAA